MFEKILYALDRKSSRLISIILFVVGFLVYIPSLFNGFVWDDGEQIIDNVIVHSLSNLFALFQGGTFYGGEGVGLIGSYYKPLMPAVFMFIYSFFGEKAFFFHLFDVVLHCANGVLVFILFQKIFRYVNFSFPRALATLLSLVFLLHPVNVESVAYIASTQELLYVFFLLFSVLLTFSLQEKYTGLKLFFLAASLLGSILSKESGITAFILVFILMFVLHMQKKRYILGTLFFTGCIYIFLRFFVAQVGIFSFDSVTPIRLASFSQRLLTIPYEIGSYIRLLIFPKTLFIEQDEVILSASDPRFYLLFPLLIVFLSAMGILVLRVKDAFFRFFVLWFGVGTLIILNIIPLDMTIAERWMYGPLIGILGALAFGLNKALQRYSLFPKIFFIGLCVILPLFILRDITRELDWYSNWTLLSHDIQLEHASARLYNDYGLTLEERGDNKGAEEYFKKSLQINASQSFAYNNLGILYADTGNILQAKIALVLAIEHGGSLGSYVNYAKVLIRNKEYTQAIGFIQSKALFTYPHSPDLYHGLYLSYNALGNSVQAAKALQYEEMYRQDATLKSQ